MDNGTPKSSHTHKTCIDNYGEHIDRPNICFKYHYQAVAEHRILLSLQLRSGICVAQHKTKGLSCF